MSSCQLSRCLKVACFLFVGLKREDQRRFVPFPKCHSTQQLVRAEHTASQVSSYLQKSHPPRGGARNQEPRARHLALQARAGEAKAASGLVKGSDLSHSPRAQSCHCWVAECSGENQPVNMEAFHSSRNLRKPGPVSSGVLCPWDVGYTQLCYPRLLDKIP